MPRPPNIDPIRAVIQELGQQIGQELAAAITHSFTQSLDSRSAPISAIARGGGARRGRPPAAEGGTPCKVAGCGRRSAAKGLCGNHYGKARRLKMNVDALTDEDLSTLGQDGRAVRFQKGASSAALVRRKGRRKAQKS